MTEGEIFGWHHQLDGHEFEQAPGIGDRQGSLACCSPWDCQESNATELNFPFDLFNPLHCFQIQSRLETAAAGLELWPARLAALWPS